MKKGRVEASKTIATLYDVDNKALIPLSECKDTLYLFCFHLVEGLMGKPERAIARKRAKLVFS